MIAQALEAEDHLQLAERSPLLPDRREQRLEHLGDLPLDPPRVGLGMVEEEARLLGNVGTVGLERNAERARREAVERVHLGAEPRSHPFEGEIGEGADRPHPQLREGVPCPRREEEAVEAHPAGLEALFLAASHDEDSAARAREGVGAEAVEPHDEARHEPRAPPPLEERRP